MHWPAQPSPVQFSLDQPSPQYSPTQGQEEVRATYLPYLPYLPTKLPTYLPTYPKLLNYLPRKKPKYRNCLLPTWPTYEPSYIFSVRNTYLPAYFRTYLPIYLVTYRAACLSAPSPRCEMPIPKKNRPKRPGQNVSVSPLPPKPLAPPINPKPPASRQPLDPKPSAPNPAPNSPLPPAVAQPKAHIFSPHPAPAIFE